MCIIMDKCDKKKKLMKNKIEEIDSVTTQKKKWQHRHISDLLSSFSTRNYYKTNLLILKFM